VSAINLKANPGLQAVSRSISADLNSPVSRVPSPSSVYLLADFKSSWPNDKRFISEVLRYTVVRILDSSFSDQWVEIQVDNTIGVVPKSYLHIPGVESVIPVPVVTAAASKPSASEKSPEVQPKSASTNNNTATFSSGGDLGGNQTVGRSKASKLLGFTPPSSIKVFYRYFYFYKK
jgi:hypothetical protein